MATIQQVMEKEMGIIGAFIASELSKRGFRDVPFKYKADNNGFALKMKLGDNVFHVRLSEVGSIQLYEVAGGRLYLVDHNKNYFVSSESTPSLAKQLSDVLIDHLTNPSGKYATFNKKAFNKENPIELMSQLMKVLRRDGLEDSVELIKRYKILKVINDEYLESRRTASEKKASPKLFDQLHSATGFEKKRLLTEMSDYGVNIMRDKFAEMGIRDRQTQQKVMVFALDNAKALRLTADRDSLKKFGRVRFGAGIPVLHPETGEKIRLSKKLRFGIFFQLVGKGFIK